MKSIGITVNGEEREAVAEPRTMLADFLRDHCNLTGTHLGCEQGVCGACTVFVDGVPVRSCITLAIACAGARVTSIEGFADDPVMADLREAFKRRHALQCGYCTPGMLIAARDLVARNIDPDAAGIRRELSGNLCRCTGYAGIVHAVADVLQLHQERAVCETAATGLAPAGAGHSSVIQATAGNGAKRAPETAADVANQKLERPSQSIAATGAARKAGQNVLTKSFVVAHPPARVWAIFGDVDAVLGCVPGASLSGPVHDGRFQAKMRVKLGPIAAEFHGDAEHVRDDANQTGTIVGAGSDARSGSQGHGTITYALHPVEDGASTRVDMETVYSLAGMLAQFARGGIVRDFAGRLTDQFAARLETLLSADTADGKVSPPDALPEEELKVGSVIWSMVMDRIKTVLARLRGR